MATRIEVPYDRQHTDAEAQAIVARADTTLSVMGQLGAAYQGLPGMAMAGYQAESESLKGDLTALNVLIDQIRPLLISIDAKVQPLDEKNKRALQTLRGLLRDDADVILLDRITGPQPQSPHPPSPPAPPSP